MDMYRVGFEDEEEVLRKIAEPVTEFNPELKLLIEDMMSFMEESNGIGLAAPQIGLLKRILIVGHSNMEPISIINPEIIETSLEENVYEEGCLSIPKMYGKVTRPKKVTVQGWNERGRPFTIKADGLLATIIQHEIDHLNGVLFIDHLSEKTREKLLKKYYKEIKK